MKIAIASGKGGTGKTLVATNLFYLLQEAGREVTLVDCDAEEPNAKVFFKAKAEKSIVVSQKVPVIDTEKCTLCGKCHDYCNYNAIFILPPANMIRVFEELCHGCGACTVACQSGAITEKDVPLGKVSCFSIRSNARLVEGRMKVGVYTPVPLIKAALKTAGNNGITLMDSPPGTSCPFIHTVSGADFVVLVTEPTPFGLSDLKQSVDTLKTMDLPCGVIVNRAGTGNREVYAYLKKEGIPLLLEIPFDRETARLYSNGKIAAREKRELAEQFLSMLDFIFENYGNSSN